MIFYGFNPHTHEGCDCNIDYLLPSDNMFQSTHPRRVWRLRVYLPSATSRFNPHTHEGCDTPWVESESFWTVSIHTPTKGVTNSQRNCVCIPIVSIHTPTKGVTHYYCYSWYHNCCFNPHTHEGCDNIFLGFLQSNRGFNPHTHEGCDGKDVVITDASVVSIHTPTKGVTYDDIRKYIARLSFNPHTHEGCDPTLLFEVGKSGFQSTHPRRVWLALVAILRLLASFNPHTHEGCDLVLRSLYKNHSSFNPHTHEGCDLKAINMFWFVC